MPNLIAKYQQKALTSQFKKSYSNLQNVINLVNAENGTPYECYTLMEGNVWKAYSTSECSVFFKEFFNQFNVISICESNDDTCRPKYKTKEEVVAEGGKTKNSNCSYPIRNHVGYFMNDGSVLYVYNFINTHNALYLAFDINGNKGPNRWGYDLFYINLVRKGITSNTTALTEICGMAEKGGKYIEEIMLD